MILIVLSVVAFGLSEWARPNNSDDIRIAMTVAHPGPITFKLKPSARFFMG